MDAFTAVAVRLQNAWFRARDEESGQGLVEYALIIAIVSLGAVLALGFLSGKINTLFSKAGNQLNQPAVTSNVGP
jgi:pilus assembly protein Flp/PilA